MNTTLTRSVESMLLYCWAVVKDGGPTLKQHLINASDLLGSDFLFYLADLFVLSVPTVHLFVCLLVLFWLFLSFRDIHMKKKTESLKCKSRAATFLTSSKLKKRAETFLYKPLHA